MTMTRIALLALALVAGMPRHVGADESSKLPVRPDQRIVFLGDSITYAGKYIAHVEVGLRRRYPAAKVDIVNLGLPSETTSGLSEPAHPFPRPTVHERLDRALARTKPALVVACYGVNDGIYHPFSEKRFGAYRKGIGTLIEKVGSSGAKLVLLTPPPFDPQPMKLKNKLRPRDAKEFAWFGIYANYDEEVMAKYAAWILAQRGRVHQVVDVRAPILQYVAEQRKTRPGFALSGDGIHLDDVGHGVIATALCRAIGLPSPSDAATEADKKVVQLVARRQQLLRDAWLSHVEHKRPGVRKGLPIEKAKVEAARLDAEIRTLLKSTSSK